MIKFLKVSLPLLLILSFVVSAQAATIQMSPDVWKVYIAPQADGLWCVENDILSIRAGSDLHETRKIYEADHGSVYALASQGACAYLALRDNNTLRIVSINEAKEETLLFTL